MATVDLMLLPREGEFRFHHARWDLLESSHPHWTGCLERARYEQLMEEQPAALAGLLNLLTALEQTPLEGGVALEHVVEVIWDPPPAPDRFFAWARPLLLEQVKQATSQGAFVRTLLPSLFHPGATASFKEIRFPFANLQLTFHEGTSRCVNGDDCVMVEPDIDYFRDPAAHALLEVVPNMILGRKTDPRLVYLLRWTATRRAATPEFAPPYAVG